MTTQLNGQVDLSSAQEAVTLPATTDVASFTDTNTSDTASDFTATIVWGDGSTSTGTVVGSSGHFTVEGGHTYSDEGFPTATVTVTRTTDNSQLSMLGTVAVTDKDTINPHGTTITFTPNTALTNVTVATFTDPTNTANTADDFTAVIDWGDGTTTAGSVQGSAGSFSIVGSHTYIAAGENTISVSIADDFPDSATGFVTSTAVSGFGGQVTLTSATEGTALTGAEVATFADTSGTHLASDYTATIVWGDGSTDTGTVSGSGQSFTVTGSHTYADEIQNGLSPDMSVTLTRTSDHATATATGTVIVADGDVLSMTPKTLGSAANQALTNVTVATFSDAYTGQVASDLTAMIDWGDGSANEIGTLSGGVGSFTVTGSHTYGADGQYHVNVSILDDLPGGEGQIGAVTSTANIGLVAGDGDDFSGNEGSLIAVGAQVATFLDGDSSAVAADFSASINWGDGTTTPGTISGSSGSFTVTSAGHTYQDEGSDTITTTITRTADHEQVAMTGQATVGEADSFSVTADNFSGNPGVAINSVQVATFTDTYLGQVAGDLTAAISWGDGTTSAGTISGGSGSFTVRGSHTYTAGGNDTFTVTVSDDSPGTATASATGTATINLGGQMVLTSATEHVALSNGTPVATFSDSNGGDTPASFTATIQWGDGVTSPGTVSGGAGSFTVSGGHTYADEGNDQASVTVTHTADMAQSTISGSVAVAEHDVLSSQNGSVTQQSGQTSITATFSDTDTVTTAGDFTATINWGDGSPITTGTVSGANGSFTVNGSHTYASSAQFTATVTLADDAPGTATRSLLVPVNPPPPAGTTSDMITHRPSTGDYFIYDLGNNSVLASHPLTNIPAPWHVVGLGGFNGTDTTDMMLRNTSTGSFEIVDVNNNNAGAPVQIGNVGLDWQVAGFGDFSSRPGETDMLTRNTNTGDFELYNFSNNTVTLAKNLGNVGLDWQVLGFGDFSGKANETDMLTRNSNTQMVQLYEISNNQVTSATMLGDIGSEWQFAGAGDFSGRPGETDLMMRNSHNGDFEIYDFQNGAITSVTPLGNVGLDWTVVGFGELNGNTNETDMVLRNTNSGQFELYDISNNQVVGFHPMGQSGLEWTTDGIAKDPPTSDAPSSGALIASNAQGASADWLTQAMHTSLTGTNGWLSQAVLASGSGFDASSDSIAATAASAVFAMPNPLQTHTA